MAKEKLMIVFFFEILIGLSIDSVASELFMNFDTLWFKGRVCDNRCFERTRNRK